MANFLKSILGSRSYLGVDIGTTSIKAVETGRLGGKVNFLNYGIIETYGHLTRVNNAIQTSSLKIVAKDTVQILKTLLAKAKFRSRDAVASIPAFSAFVTLLEAPSMSEGDTQKALRFQIPQYIPLPIEEITIDWLKVGEREDENGILKQQILLISIPNDTILRYKEIFKLAGLNLRFLEIESFGLIRSLCPDGEVPTLIVDIGSRSTNIVIAEKGFLKYNAQTDYAGASLTQAIANGLGIDVRRAEEMKKQRGILLRSPEYELSTLVLPFLDAIINEVKRAKNIFEKNPNSRVGQIILTGGGAKLLGVAQYFKEQIGLDTVMANPFGRLSYPRPIEILLPDLGPTFSLAIGLGIKEFV